MALIDSEGFGLSLVYGNYLTYGLLVTSRWFCGGRAHSARRRDVRRQLYVAVEQFKKPVAHRAK